MEVPEFDFEGAVPNPFAEQYRQGVAVRVIRNDGSVQRVERYVRLDDDVAAQFPSSKAVNEALRLAIMRKATQEFVSPHEQDYTEPSEQL